MVTGFQRDNRGMVPWVNEREVVGAHLVDALSVFVDERGVDNGVKTVGKGANTEQGIVN